MLRVLSGRLVRLGTSPSQEPRIVTLCCVSNITPSLKVSSIPLQRTLTTTAPESDEVIYKGRLERDIFRVKCLSITTSVMGLAFQPVLYSQASSLPVVVATCSVVGFFTFVTPILLHQLAKRHVNTVTYNQVKDSYVAHTTTFFFQERKIPIEPGEAKVPEQSGMFTSLEVRGIPLMVEMAAFDKKHLIRLLGYDKPLDLQHERLSELVKKAQEKKKMKDSKQDQCEKEKDERASSRV